MRAIRRISESQETESAWPSVERPAAPQAAARDGPSAVPTCLARRPSGAGRVRWRASFAALGSRAANPTQRPRRHLAGRHPVQLEAGAHRSLNHVDQRRHELLIEDDGQPVTAVTLEPLAVATSTAPSSGQCSQVRRRAASPSTSSSIPIGSGIRLQAPRPVRIAIVAQRRNWVAGCHRRRRKSDQMTLRRRSRDALLRGCRYRPSATANTTRIDQLRLAGLRALIIRFQPNTPLTARSGIQRAIPGTAPRATWCCSSSMPMKSLNKSHSRSRCTP